jgi:hypothetical protein
MIGHAILAAVSAIVGAVAIGWGLILSAWLALRAPLAALFVGGMIMLTLAGLWLSAAGL